MKIENLKPVENKKMTETVLEIKDEEEFEKTEQVNDIWERKSGQQEREIFEERHLTEELSDEENIPEVEVVEIGTFRENQLTNNPVYTQKFIPLDPQTNKPFFMLEIELENFYITDAGFWGSFLGFSNQIKKLTLEKTEEAKDLLEGLEKGEWRLVDNYWGLEGKKAQEIKEELIEGLKIYIDNHERGELVLGRFQDL